MEPLAAAPQFSPTACVSVVIPTFNEADSITGVIQEIPHDLVREVIIADGGSTDGTQALARAAGATVLDAGRGYGRACHLGAKMAQGSIIVFLDGDGADRADLLGVIIQPILTGTHDFVLASRTLGQRDPGSMLWHQVLAGRIAGVAIGALYGTKYSDMCAFRAVKRAVHHRNPTPLPMPHRRQIQSRRLPTRNTSGRWQDHLHLPTRRHR
jgi:glycosyltransferase involved in cell wall biosynthesis